MTETIPISIPKIVLTTKQIIAILSALALFTGIYAAGHQQQQLTEIQQRTLDVKQLMSTVSHDSSIQDLKDTQDRLRLQAVWANRQPQTKEVKEFLVFLEDCNQQVISYSK